MDPRYLTLEIKGSSSKLIGLGLLGIGLVALSAFVFQMGWRSTVASQTNYFSRLGILGISSLAVAFFGWTTWIAFSRFFSAGSTVITLNRQGLHDTRVSERPVPWESIGNVGVWEMSGQKIIVVSVPPNIEASVGLSRITKWTRSANKGLGADGLSISATGLEMKHDELLAAIMERVKAAQGTR